jgi:hypothetical protein
LSFEARLAPLGVVAQLDAGISSCKVTVRPMHEWGEERNSFRSSLPEL